MQSVLPGPGAAEGSDSEWREREEGRERRSQDWDPKGLQLATPGGQLNSQPDLS